MHSSKTIFFTSRLQAAKQFLKWPQMRTVEETDLICEELGDKAVRIIGIIAKKGVRICNTAYILDRPSVINPFSCILSRIFNVDPTNCSSMIGVLSHDFDGIHGTYEEYARKCITHLNLCSKTGRLKVM